MIATMTTDRLVLLLDAASLIFYAKGMIRDHDRLARIRATRSDEDAWAWMGLLHPDIANEAVAYERDRPF